MHQSIGVNQCLLARGISTDPRCPCCHGEPETILHALRDCPFNKSAWIQLGKQTSDPFFFSASLQDWLIANANSQAMHHQGPGQCPWYQVFLFAIWLIWKGRNQCLFNNKNPNPNIAKEILDRAFEFTHCACTTLVKNRRILMSIRWEKPCSGWFKLNTDGSSLGNPGLAGGGGLIRDENGDWVVGFARKIGIANSFMAELWALRDGLLLCLQTHVQAVIVEMDSKVIVDTFSTHAEASSTGSAILEDCKQLVAQIPQVWFNHVYREANKCADFLAKLGASLDIDFNVFSSPPVDLLNLWEADALGLSCNRLCSAPSFVF
ncbi:hypothetical protein SO802_001162 [Lithocarpus litseifolius]|uniref:RNase H type-1 domain-containing protein n=1 Tax=Lithocarpus litseifolius TaxID=425828 RepID=A0AAW2DWZ8_9ROSI